MQKIFKVFLFIILFFNKLIYAATPSPQDVAQQQDVLQRQRQFFLQQQLQNEQDVHLPTDKVKDIPTSGEVDDNYCFYINKISLVGKHHELFQYALDYALQEIDFPNHQCLNAHDINRIMNIAQNALIHRGYTTTRILVAPQDLNTGILEFTLMAGKIRNIHVDTSNQKQDHSNRIARFQNEFPIRSDRILNLHNLEQALENLKRIPTAEVNLQIVPVENRPDESDIVVQWSQRLIPIRFAFGIEDSGSKATGKYQGNITFIADNPLGLSDLFYIYYGQAIGNKPSERSNSGEITKGDTYNYSIHYSVPFGKWLWSFNHSAYRYHQAVAGLNEVFDYNGRSKNTDFGFNYLIYRNNSRKSYLGLRLWQRESRSYVNDTEIKIQHRRTSGWLMELSHKEYIKHITTQFKLSYKRGTGMNGAKTAPEESFGTGTSRMKIWTLTTDINIPFYISKQLFSYDSLFHLQWNKTPLSPQDQLAIGGRYNVRGFDGELNLSAERGWYSRNNLNWHYTSHHQFYFGADIGHVSGPSSKWQLGNTLAGATFGAQGQFNLTGNLYYDFFISHSLKKPQHFQTKKWATGFQISYFF